MTAIPDVEDFLRVEDAADQLLTELTALRRETVSFSGAHATLSAAAERLGMLLGVATEATKQVGESARALREIGTPELLAQQAQLRAQLETAVKVQAEQHGQVRAQLERGAKALSEKQEDMRTQFANLEKTHEERQGKLQAQLETAAKAQEEQEERLKLLKYHVTTTSEKAESSASRTQTLLRLVGLAVVVSTIIEVAVFLFLKARS